MRRIPALMAVLAALAMVAPCFAQVAGKPPQAPPVDERLSALESRVAALEARGTHAGGFVAGLGADAKCTCVHKADGTCVARVCDSSGCREIPCDCSSCCQAATTPYPPYGPRAFADAPISYGAPIYLGDGGGCANGQCGMSMGGPMFMGSGGGGCASGNCGSSGGRGRGRRGR